MTDRVTTEQVRQDCEAIRKGASPNWASQNRADEIAKRYKAVAAERDEQVTRLDRAIEDVSQLTIKCHHAESERQHWQARAEKAEAAKRNAEFLCASHKNAVSRVTEDLAETETDRDDWRRRAEKAEAELAERTEQWQQQRARAVKAEAERDRACLVDWTPSIIDRLNEMARENLDDLHTIDKGPDACDLIRRIHGHFNNYKADNARLAAIVERLAEKVFRLAVHDPARPDIRGNFSLLNDHDHVELLEATREAAEAAAKGVGDE